MVNSRPDLVVEIREEDLERVQTRCPEIVEPGVYIVDFKTAASKYDNLYYTGGLQALWYPLSWELEHPASAGSGHDLRRGDQGTLECQGSVAAV